MSEGQKPSKQETPACCSDGGTRGIVRSVRSYRAVRLSHLGAGCPTRKRHNRDSSKKHTNKERAKAAVGESVPIRLPY